MLSLVTLREYYNIIEGSYKLRQNKQYINQSINVRIWQYKPSPFAKISDMHFKQYIFTDIKVITPLIYIYILNWPNPKAESAYLAILF